MLSTFFIFVDWAIAVTPNALKHMAPAKTLLRVIVIFKLQTRKAD